MPPTKTPTSSLSGSHTTHVSSLHLTICDPSSDRVARQASLVPNLSQNPENAVRGCFSRDLYDTLAPRSRASPGNHQKHYQLYCLRHIHSPCMHPDLLLMVYRRRPSSPLRPRNRNTLFRPKGLAAQSPLVHVYARLAPFGQEVTGH